MQETQVQSLVWEDPTGHGATKSVCHNYWARMPARLKPMLHNKRRHRNEKSAHRNEEYPSLDATRESPRAAMKTQRSQNK